LKHFPEFWKVYSQLVKGPNFLEMSARLSMSEFCNLLYTCAHLELFDKQHEWPILLEAFCRKLKYQPHFDDLISCMLSLTLADVGDSEDFWQPLCDMLIGQLEMKPNPTEDFILLQNLFYILAQQKSKVRPEQIGSLLGLVGDLPKFIKSFTLQAKMSNVMGHFVYSLGVLKIKDSAIW